MTHRERILKYTDGEGLEAKTIRAAAVHIAKEEGCAEDGIYAEILMMMKKKGIISFDEDEIEGEVAA